jgi:hypothetical protein
MLTPRELLELEIHQMRQDDLHRLGDRNAKSDRWRDEERDRLAREEVREEDRWLLQEQEQRDYERQLAEEYGAGW